jgi:hypothetical protein
MMGTAPPLGSQPSAVEVVDTAIARTRASGLPPVRVAIVEADVERFATKLGRAAMDELASIAGGATPTDEGGDWRTRVSLHASDGRELGSGVVAGRLALRTLPRALAYARQAGCVVDVESRALSRRFVPSQPLGAPAPPSRSPDELVRLLRRGRWRVEQHAHGATLERWRAGRETGLMILAILGLTLFLPITVIVAAAALVLRGPPYLSTLARALFSPFRHLEERIRIELVPGRLRYVVTRNGQPTVERSFDDADLLAVHAPNAFERSVLLFTPEELVEMPCLARGESAESFSPPESDALAELAVHVWSWPRPPG